MSTPKYIDVHIHLADIQQGQCLEKAIEQAHNVCVEKMLCVSAVQDDWDIVLGLSRKYKCVIPFFGLHPWVVEELKDGWDEDLQKLAAENACGIGEIGLDRHLTKADFNIQCKIFTRQLEIAKALGRPVSIHCLKAYGKLYDILSEASPLPQGSFIHSYSGAAEMIERFSSLGLMFSYNGKAMDDTAINYIANIKATPLDKILLETDSPFMVPSVMRHQQGANSNRPSNLPLFAKRISDIKNISLEQLAAAALINSEKILSAVKGL